jgi:hypothetical protein
MDMNKGTIETKQFYDNIGWHRNANGRLIDNDMFKWSDEPVKMRLDRLRQQRIRALVGSHLRK